METLTEELIVNDGRSRIRLIGEPPFQPVVQLGRAFQFELCRKPVSMGEFLFDQWWIWPHTIYGERNQSGSSREAIVDCFWTICLGSLTVTHRPVQESYVLAKLFPQIRSNGAKRVFADAALSRGKSMGGTKNETVAELDRLLARSRSRELGKVEFRDNTAQLLGPPEYPAEVWAHYNQFEADLLGEGCDALEQRGEEALGEVLNRWDNLMKTIGRHRGHLLEKQALDILSYESRAAIHRCYSAVWELLIVHLAGKYGMSDESLMFHRFWHQDRMEVSDDPEIAFHLFHGHIFGLHPACANFMLSATGPRLIGDWLADPSSPSVYRKMLHGLFVALHAYARRHQVYAELRKKQPGLLDGLDLERLEEDQMQQAGRRRQPRPRPSDAR